MRDGVRVQGNCAAGLTKHSQPGHACLTPMNPDYEYALPAHLALAKFETLGSAVATSTGHWSTAVGHPCTRRACQAGAVTCTSTLPSATIGAANHNCNEICGWANCNLNGSSEGSEDTSELHVKKTLLWSAVPTGEIQLAERSKETDATEKSGHTCQAQPAMGKPENLRSSDDGTRQGRLCSHGDVTPAGGTALGTDQSQRQEQWLHWQLNQFKKDDVFMGRFEVLGKRQRRRGGANGDRWLPLARLEVCACDAICMNSVFQPSPEACSRS